MSFRISWSPQRRDTALTVSKSGTTLTVNGTPHDFSALTDGGSQAAPNADFVGPVTRVNGDIRVKLVLPLEPMPVLEKRFPVDTLNANGSVALPAAPSGGTDLVGKALGTLAPTGMYVRRASNVFYVGIGWPGGAVTESKFIFNADGLLLYRGTKAGEADAAGTTVGGIKPLKTVTAVDVVSSNSVPDFAVSAKPAGAAYSDEWVPMHGAVSGVSGSVTQTIKLSGVALGNGNDFANTAVTSFSIDQTFNALNPNGNAGAMWAHTVNHSISFADPRLTIHNRLDFAQDTAVTVGYLGMLPVQYDSITDLWLNDGTSYAPLNDGSEASFAADVVTSVIAVGDFSSALSYAAAITAADASMQAAPGKVTFRADGITKIYWTAIAAGTKPTGSSIEATQYIAVAAGPKTTVRGLLAF